MDQDERGIHNPLCIQITKNLFLVNQSKVYENCKKLDLCIIPAARKFNENVRACHLQ